MDLVQDKGERSMLACDFSKGSKGERHSGWCSGHFERLAQGGVYRALQGLAIRRIAKLQCLHNFGRCWAIELHTHSKHIKMSRISSRVKYDAERFKP